MSFEAERQAIEALFSANFSDTEIKYENIPFNQPDNVAWVALMIRNNDADQISLGPGNPLQRYKGNIEVHIYVPEDQGTKVAKQHADTIFPIFLNKKFSASNSGTITTTIPSYINLGINDGWYHTIVMVPFRRDRIF